MHRTAPRSHPIAQTLAVLLGMALVALFGFPAPSASAAPKDPKPSNKLACYGTGACTVNPDGSYTLANRVIPGVPTGTTTYGQLTFSGCSPTYCTENGPNDYSFVVPKHGFTQLSAESTAAGHTLNSISSFKFSYEQSQYNTLFDFWLSLDTDDNGEYDTYARARHIGCLGTGNGLAGTIDVLQASNCGIETYGAGVNRYHNTWDEFLADFGDATVPTIGRSIHFNFQHENLSSNPETATARIYDVEYTSTEVTGTAPDTTDQYSGVYLTNGSLAGKTFEDITSLGFSYTGDVSGGSPRFSIPITGGGYVFIDAATCGDGARVAPLTNPTCTVSGYTDGRSFHYSSWASFLAAENLVVSAESTFIVADQPGTVTVSDIEIGNSAKGRR